MRKALFISCAVFMLSSCNVPGRFSIVESEGPVFNGLTSVHGKALVENDAKKDLVVENAVLIFRYKKRELATARLMLPVEISAVGISRVRYDLKLESESLSDLQILQGRMETNPSHVFVDVTAWIRYGKIRRRIEMKDVSYTEIIANFGQLQRR